MNHHYYKLGVLLALWPLVQLASGQGLTLGLRSPNTNTSTANTTTNVDLIFNQALSSDDATRGGIRVFSAQRGGLLRNGQGGSASVSGSTLSFNPSTNFRPGETVFVTATTAIQSTSGARLNRGQVYQFTTKVGGTGRGYFTPPTTNAEVSVGDGPQSIAVGDLDGDSDLDMLTANRDNRTVSVRLNNGSGSFIPHPINPEVNVGAGTSPTRTKSVVLGDVDGDGDLDFVTANSANATASVRLNDGSGSFSPHPNNPEVSVSSLPGDVALGDVDGDGDLDLLVTNSRTDISNVSVRLNDGSGNFTPPALNPEVSVGRAPQSVALGDVDGDGDLDFVTANYSSDNVSVRLNDGSGNFTAPAINPNPGVQDAPGSVALGDVDRDGDLDLVCANTNGASVSVRLNDGSGNFTAPAVNPDPRIRNGASSVSLGDVDGDGSLDIVAAAGPRVSILLNNGLGSFSTPITNSEVNTPDVAYNGVLGDIDGDGDLDLLAAIDNLNSVSVRLNGPFPPPTITGLAASDSPVCAGQPVTFRASVGNLSSSYSYTLTSGSTTISGISTSSTFSQSLTASGSGVQPVTLTVNSNGQTTTATTSVTVSQCVTLSGLSASPNPACAGQPIAFQASVGNLGGSYSYTLTNGSSTTSGTATSSSFSPSLTASGSGVQNFTLTVATPDQRATAATSVTVSQCVTLSGLSASPNPVCAGQSIAFRATLGNLGGSYSYTLTNGSSTTSGTGTSSTFTQSLKASGSGVQTFTLTVATSDQVATATTTVPVNQCLTRTGQAPSRNAIYAPVQSEVNLLFSQLLSNNAATLGGVRVFSAQRGGLLRNGQGGTASVTGNTNRLRFDPSTNFKPGETVFVTSTTAIQSTGGNTAPRQVYQFTTGVLGTGRGNFMPPAVNPNPGVGTGPISVAVGDVDGDGDLDFVTANYINSATVSVRLNNGSGSFTPPTVNPNPSVGDKPISVALGDVDGDGDLDLLTANQNSDNVSVRLNDGLGNFTPPTINPNPSVGDFPISVVVGDVDGDGDLDLLTANGTGTVSVRLNDGSGNFTPPAINPDPGIREIPWSVALGDVDGDGDLDLLTANGTGTVSVRLNDGSGNFTPPATNPNSSVGDSPVSVVLGDVDNDGDLDFVTANQNSANVSVRLNDGSGNFSAPAINPNPGVENSPTSVVLGDVDGDSDLDILTVNRDNRTVSVRLNDGSGNFTPPAINPEIAVGAFPQSVVVGDVDGDGDLDLLCANSNSNSVSVRLNGALPLILTGVSASPNPVCGGQPLTVTASVGNFTTSYSYTLTNGSTTVSGSATTPVFSRSLTASGSGRQTFTLTVSSQGQVATATTSVMVNAAPTASVSASSTTALVGQVVSLSASGAATYQWAAPAGAILSLPTTTPTVSATLTRAGTQTFTLTASQGSCSQTQTLDVTVIQSPDLIPILYALPTVVNGTRPITVVVDVVELLGTATSGTIQVYISKDPKMSLNFSASDTNVGGHSVSNSVWDFDGSSNSSYHILTTDQVIKGGDKLSFGLSGSLTPGATKGQLTISAVVLGGSGGEVNLTNNVDAEKIDYFQQ